MQHSCELVDYQGVFELEPSILYTARPFIRGFILQRMFNKPINTTLKKIIIQITPVTWHLCK